MSKKKSASTEEGKKKEQKIIYIDDGSTIADMSGTYGKKGAPPPKSTFRERARTFFGVMKKMVLPMLVTLIAFTLIYVVLLIATGNL